LTKALETCLSKRTFIGAREIGYSHAEERN
jgi:hypothetical protein